MPLAVIAQNTTIQNTLRSKYGGAQYHSECDGWYLLSYSKGSQTMYGFADKNGNVIAENATKYKLHKGYIELYVLDVQKKTDHDQWLTEKQQYDIDYKNYEKIKASYDAELKTYNSNVQIAKKEAERRWKIAQDQAAKQAEAEQRMRQQQQQSSNAFVAILSGINNGLAVANARNAVQFEPFFDQVKAERNLSVGPTEPYNPYPYLRNEPSSGYEWQNFCLRQPCPYDYIDYSQISEPESFADVRKDGYWGLVSSDMKEVVACTNGQKVRQEWYDDNTLMIRKNSGYGIIDKKGNEKVPCEYSSIKREGNRYMICKDGKYGLMALDGSVIMPCSFEKMESSNGYLMCKQNGLWGVYTTNFEELYPCQFQNVNFSSIDGKLVLNTQVKGLKGIIDFTNGQPLLANQFNNISTVKAGNAGTMYIVEKEGKKGLFSNKGVIILPCEFDNIIIGSGDDPEIYVTKNQLNGIYTIDGLLTLEPKYKTITAEGICYLVTTDDGMGACNGFGQIMVPCKYSELKYDNALKGFIAKRDNTIGVVTVTGEELFPFVEASSLAYSSKYNCLTANGKGNPSSGAVDYDGNIIVPLKQKYTKLDNKIIDVEKKNPSLAASKTTKLAILNGSYSKFVNAWNAEKLLRSTFSKFAQNYVERVINEWQRRGEFEKKETWEARVNRETRQQKVYELTKEAQQTYIDKYSRKLPAAQLSIVGQYDADNETYRLKSNYADKDILVNVPYDDAQEFKAQFDNLKKYPTFFIENDKLGLAEYTFEMANGRLYKYSNQASLNYSIAQVDYNFDPITIDQSASNKNYTGGKQTISTTQMGIGISDVDVAIPVTNNSQPNTFAVIIANENYQNEKRVDFAYNDGQIFRDYCTKALGIPSENVHFRANATLNDIRFEVNWVKQIASTFKGDAKFIIYYAGHGMPDDASRQAYLLPIDGFSSDLASGYKLSDLYDVLSKVPSQNIMMFIDACFSGSARNGETLASARGIAIKPAVSEPKGNLVVFSAATDKETAYPYKEKYHGLFTYYLLKHIKEADGVVNLGNLTDYVTNEVSKKSIVVNRKSQTPTVCASIVLKDTWKNIRVR